MDHPRLCLSFSPTFSSILCGKSEQALCNSSGFVQRVKQVTIDVVSLFTNVSITLAVEVAGHRFVKYDIWKQDGAMLNHTDVRHLPSGFLFSICFIFGSAYYKQVFDTAIVSPVSNVVLNVVMEELEEHNIPSFIMWLSVWYYHVDSGRHICHLSQQGG